MHKNRTRAHAPVETLSRWCIVNHWVFHIVEKDTIQNPLCFSKHNFDWHFSSLVWVTGATNQPRVTHFIAYEKKKQRRLRYMQLATSFQWIDLLFPSIINRWKILALTCDKALSPRTPAGQWFGHSFVLFFVRSGVATRAPLVSCPQPRALSRAQLCAAVGSDMRTSAGTLLSLNLWRWWGPVRLWHLRWPGAHIQCWKQNQNYAHMKFDGNLSLFDELKQSF